MKDVELKSGGTLLKLETVADYDHWREVSLAHGINIQNMPPTEYPVLADTKYVGSCHGHETEYRYASDVRAMAEAMGMEVKCQDS